MKKSLMQILEDGLKEMKEIRAGKRKPSRSFYYDPKTKKIVRKN